MCVWRVGVGGVGCGLVSEHIFAWLLGLTGVLWLCGMAPCSFFK